jgi:hypothetical protein
MHYRDAFDSCSFVGYAKNCNFAKATFVNCTFSQGFKFIDCNMSSTTGLTEDLVQGGCYSTKAQYDETRAQMHASFGLPLDDDEE